MSPRRLLFFLILVLSVVLLVSLLVFHYYEECDLPGRNNNQRSLFQTLDILTISSNTTNTTQHIPPLTSIPTGGEDAIPTTSGSEINTVTAPSSTTIDVVPSTGMLTVGSINDVVSNLAVYFNAHNHPIVISKQKFNPNFDLNRRRQKGIDTLNKAKISSMFLDYTDTTSKVKELLKKNTYDTIVFVPPSVASLYNDQSTIKGFKSVLVNLAKLLQKMASGEIEVTRLVCLAAIPANPIEESLLDLITLVLYSYQSNHKQLQLSMAHVEEGFNEMNCKNFEDLVHFVNFDHKVSKDLVQKSEFECTNDEFKSPNSLIPIKKRNVLFSTYFTDNKQFVRPYRENSFQFVKGFMITAKRHNAHIVIYYDRLSDGYKDRLLEYYSEIEFIQYKGNYYHRSINDARFYIMYDYLEAHPEIDRIILQDLRDGIFITDPFRVMETVGDYLFLGMDSSFHRGFRRIAPYAKCVTAKRKKLYPPSINYYPKLNAGSLGGTRHMILAFLRQMMTLFKDYFPPRYNCNMDTFDLAGHEFFKNVMFTGYPFQAFMQIGLTTPPGTAIRHKRTKFDL